MSKNVILIVALAVGLGLVFEPQIRPYLPGRTATTVVDPPPAALQQLVAPIQPMMTNHPQKAEYREYCLAAANTIQRDGGQILKTAADLSKFNEFMTAFRFRNDFQATKGLADAMNEAMLQWVGKKADALDAERRSKAVQCYQAFAWAAGG